MDVNKLHETKLSSSAEVTGFSAEVKKRTEDVTVINATKEGRAVAGND